MIMGCRGRGKKAGKLGQFRGEDGREGSRYKQRKVFVGDGLFWFGGNPLPFLKVNIPSRGCRIPCEKALAQKEGTESENL